MEVAAIPAVGQHHGAALAAEACQLRSILVVKVGHRCARRIGTTAREQYSLGREILVHGLVIIEVVARQVREHGNIKGHPEHSFLRQGMRRDFHDRIRRAQA